VGLERSKQRPRLAKLLHSQKVSVTWAEKIDQKLASVLVTEKTSWATATQSIQMCKTQIEQIGGLHVDTDPTAWGLEAQVWHLLWTGEEAMQKGNLKKGRIRKSRRLYQGQP